VNTLQAGKCFTTGRAIIYGHTGNINMETIVWNINVDIKGVEKNYSCKTLSLRNNSFFLSYEFHFFTGWWDLFEEKNPHIIENAFVHPILQCSELSKAGGDGL
jgi:hypothetical protein